MNPYYFMKYVKLKSLAMAIFIFLSCTSCESKYSSLVKKELSSGIQHDSLVFNMKFGDTRPQFFEMCSKLNKKGLVSQGPNNDYVAYSMPSKNSNKGESVIMLFYGKFDERNEMIGMDMIFNYKGWSPWTKVLTAENLAPSIIDTLESWYPGNKFIELSLPKSKKKAFVKVDGNRQIVMYPENSKDLVVKFQDLNYKYPSQFK